MEVALCMNSRVFASHISVWFTKCSLQKLAAA